MKQFFTFFAVLVMAMALPKVATAAYDFSAVSPSGHTLYYKIYNGSTSVSVVFPGYNSTGYSSNYYWNGYVKPSGVLVIPDTVSYGDTIYSVTRIYDNAFRNCNEITSIVIPSSVTYIGDYAFTGCTGLSSVEIPNSVKWIGNYSFAGCTGLSSVIISDSVSFLGSEAFSGCSGLTRVSLPNSNIGIPSSAFEQCTGLTSIVIPNSITGIGAFAFNNCTNLTSVTIGSGVTAIQRKAFSGCSSLMEIISLAQVAPGIGYYDEPFEGVPTTINVFIPCGCLSSYSNRWSHFSNFSQIAVTNINVTVSSDSTKGYVSVLENCNHSKAIIRATPYDHYHFDHWSNGSTINPDTLFISGDSSVFAFFEPNLYTINVESANETLGCVSGSGDYPYLDTITIEAIVIADHYHFNGWNDNNMENPRQYVVTGDANLRAFFSIDKYTISAVPNNSERGAVTGGRQYAYGSVCTLTAGAFSGYQFACWSDGSTSNPYIFAVSEDVELTALFVAEGDQICTVNAVSADPTKGIVRGGGMAVIGDIVTLRAIARPGCYFVRWNDNNTDSVRTIEVHGDITYTAYFEGSAGVDDVFPDNLRIFSKDKQIILEGIEGKRILIFDIMGRPVYSQTSTPCRISVPVPHTGIYIVKVDNYPSRKIVVIE